MKKGMRYNDSGWSNNRYQEKLKPIAIQEPERNEKKGIYLILDDKFFNHVKGNCHQGDAKENAGSHNDSCYMARLLLNAVKSIPETSVPM
jgi:hypothetical protein